MQKEYVVLVDDNNEPIGQMAKSEVHTSDTPLHRAFSVFLFDKSGQLLLQQRSSTKKTWPLVWSNSCCGHPGPGEETEAAAHRRVEQELGISGIDLWNVLPNFRYRAELKGIVENEICPVFVGFIDVEPNPNSEEIESVKWIHWDEFLMETEKEDSIYSPWAILEAAELKGSNDFSKLYKKHTHTS